MGNTSHVNENEITEGHRYYAEALSKLDISINRYFISSTSNLEVEMK